MKESGLIFNREMVRAILNGTKTMTRRIMKKQPPDGWYPVGTRDVADKVARTYTKGVIDRHGSLQAGPEVFGVADDTWGIASPFGQPGDRIWVRETWWQAGYGYPTYPGDDEYAWHGSRRVHYAADGNPPNEPNCDYPKGLYNGSFSAAEPNRIWWKRPSIHMPRWAARILLDITEVRAERLNDISEADAEAEGIDFLRHIPDADETISARQLFEFLWVSIYGQESWDSNPWVWVYPFKVLATTQQGAAKEPA